MANNPNWAAGPSPYDDPNAQQDQRYTQPPQSAQSTPLQTAFGSSGARAPQLYSAEMPQTTAASGAPTPTPTSAEGPPLKREYTPQEASAAGLGWVPANSPLYGTPGYVGSQPAAPAAGTPGAPTTPAGPTVAGTANKTLTDLLTQPEFLDRNSQEFRAMSEPYAAAIERQRRASTSQEAEAASAEGRDFGSTERRLIDERAGQQTGLFEADLARNVLEGRRQTKMQALQLALQQGDAEQARALQRELAQLDASIRRESTAATTSLGNRELDVRSTLGNRGMDIDIMRLLLADQQFGKDLGFRIGATQADLNQRAGNALLEAWR
jgi:hypothetical protein